MDDTETYGIYKTVEVLVRKKNPLEQEFLGPLSYQPEHDSYAVRFFLTFSGVQKWSIGLK